MVERQPRLLVSLDATASRAPTWAYASKLQRDMFIAAHGNNLAVQLCYYRGASEFHASPWLTRTEDLLQHMAAVQCAPGATQIGKLIRHYLAAGSVATPVRALIFIGDAVEENSGQLFDLAARCRIKGQPLFIFQEGFDSSVADVFRQLAVLSGGAYAQFDNSSAEFLRDLLSSVARFASGGRKALTQSGRDSDKLLLSQLQQSDSCQN